MIFEVGNDMNFKKTFAIYEKESNRTAIVTLLLIAPFFRGIKKTSSALRYLNGQLQIRKIPLN